MQFKCEILDLKRRFSVSLLRATDIIQNSLVISLHSTLTHDMMTSKEVMDKKISTWSDREIVCYVRHRIINATSFITSWNNEW